MASAESRRRSWWQQTHSLVILQLNPKALQTKSVLVSSSSSSLGYITAERLPPTLFSPSALTVLQHDHGAMSFPASACAHVITTTPMQVWSRQNILAKSMWEDQGAADPQAMKCVGCEEDLPGLRGDLHAGRIWVKASHGSVISAWIITCTVAQFVQCIRHVSDSVRIQKTGLMPLVPASTVSGSGETQQSEEQTIWDKSPGGRSWLRPETHSEGGITCSLLRVKEWVAFCLATYTIYSLQPPHDPYCMFIY